MRPSLRSGQRLGSRTRTSSPIDSPIQQVDGPHPEVHDEPVGPLCIRWVNEQLSQNSDNADDRPSPQQELSEELHQEVQDLQELLPADPWFGRLHQNSQELSQDIQQELEQEQDQELTGPSKRFLSIFLTEWIFFAYHLYCVRVFF